MPGLDPQLLQIFSQFKCQSGAVVMTYIARVKSR
jgi:hypothetical protein